MAFDQRELRSFLAVVDHGSLGRAADAACMTQPALSRLIGTMEERLGQPLFDRHSKGMALTAAGELLTPHARLLLFEMQQAVGELDALRGLGTGRVRIGAVAAVTRTILPGAITRLLELAPALQVSVLDAPDDQLATALADRDIDLMIAPPLAPHADIWPIAECDAGDFYAAFSAATHPLAAMAEVTMQQVLAESWAMPPPGGAPRMLFERHVTEAGGPLPRVALETNSIGVMLACVTASRLLGWLPYPLLVGDIQRGAVVALQVPALSIERRFFVYTRRRGSLAPAARQLLAVLPLKATVTPDEKAEFQC
ncbi:MAG: LysR family transcriptional regulator [Sphingomonas sp.]